MLKKFLYWLLGMGATNFERTIVAVTALVGCTILALMKVVDSNSVTVIYSMIVGYVFGHASGIKAEQLKNGDHLNKMKG